MKRRGHLEDLMYSWRILLKWILSKWVRGCGLRYNLSQDSLESPCENDNKSQVFLGITVHHASYLIAFLPPSSPPYLSEHTEITVQAARSVL